MEITNQLLAAYAEGNVSNEERNAVRQYLTEHPDQLETVMMMMDEDFELEEDDEDLENENALPHSFNDELDTLLNEIDNHDTPLINILPLRSKAAQNNEDNLCAIRCEGYALRTLGVDITDDELTMMAEKRGLLNDDGTALYNIGQLSSQYGLYVSRKYNCTVSDIERSLNHGDVVMAVIDNTELSLDPQEAERIDRLYGELPNHALIIKSIDIDRNIVTLLNPGENDELNDYPLDVFLEAWDDSANYLIISNRNHYKPHPVNLEDIHLDDNIMQLQDVFAENIHEVWAKERKEEGWMYGLVFNAHEKTDPNLLPFDLLTQQEKEHCRILALESIKLLEKLGWQLTKKSE